MEGKDYSTAKPEALERLLGSRCVSAAAPTKLLKGRMCSPCPDARLVLPSRTGPSREPRRTLAVAPLIPDKRYYGEGMGIVTGAPWHTQDAVAERTEAVSP